jgi:hypothetical protein
MNSLETGASLLAEQSIFAQLTIHPRPAVVSGMQLENDHYFITHPLAHKINNVNTDDYCITNMSPLVHTLPVNSIFDHVLYIKPNLPDIRFVKVDTSEHYKSSLSYSSPISDELETLNLHDNLASLGKNVQTIFKPAPSAKQYQYNSKFDIQSIREFDMTRMFPSLYTDVTTMLETLPINNSIMTKGESVADILKNLNITDIAYMNDVVDNRVFEITDKTILVRTVYDLINSLDDESISKLNFDVNKRIAKMVDILVKNYKSPRA